MSKTFILDRQKALGTLCEMYFWLNLLVGVIDFEKIDS